MKRLAASLLLFLFWATVALGHEVRPAYLEIRETAQDTYEALWKVPARGEDMRLALYVQLPESAQPVTVPIGRFVDAAYIERWSFELPGGLEGHSIYIEGLPSTKVDALIRVTSLEGITETLRATPDSPSVQIAGEVSGIGVATTYTVIGIEHILLGIDHLLFVLALILIVRGWKKLLKTITSFTLAHSITLALATLGFVHVPGPPVEACIALSIVFVAAEIVHSKQGRRGLTEQAPWIVAFIFGLLHGLGFAGALSEVGLPDQAIPLALLFFNVGVELGQIAFVLVVLSVVAVWRKIPVEGPRWGWRLAPYAIGSMAMFWVVERTLNF